MRLGVAMAYQSQIVNEYCQDILFGIPRPHNMRVDLGCSTPDFVNALPTGTSRSWDLPWCNWPAGRSGSRKRKQSARRGCE